MPAGPADKAGVRRRIQQRRGGRLAQAGEAGGGEAEEPANAAMGEPAADGQFTFTVQDLECGASEVGEDFLVEEAQGQFCVLTVRVENTGDSAQALFASDQYLLEADGTQHSASSEATLVLDPNGDTLFSEINPGNAIEGQVAFDVPGDAEVVTAELHDSTFSDGVEVDLR